MKNTPLRPLWLTLLGVAGVASAGPLEMIQIDPETPSWWNWEKVVEGRRWQKQIQELVEAEAWVEVGDLARQILARPEVWEWEKGSSRKVVSSYRMVNE